MPKILTPKDASDGSKFIVSRIAEALWEYQIDSYKRPAMNSGALLWEFNHLLEEYYKGNIPLKTIDYSFEELTNHLGQGEIAGRIQDVSFRQNSDYLRNLSNQKFSSLKKDKRHEIMNRAKYLLRLYFVNCFDIVEHSLEEFCKDPHQKKEISRLIGSWLTELVHRGMSHDGLNEFFRKKVKEINEPKEELILKYVKEIHQTLEDYNDPSERGRKSQFRFNVTLKVTYKKWTYLKKLIDSLDQKKIKLIGSIDVDDKRRKFFKNEHNSTWIQFKINAPDAMTAVAKTCDHIERLFAYITFENHQANLAVFRWAWVRQGRKFSELCKVPSQAVHKRADGSADDLSTLVKRILDIRSRGALAAPLRIAFRAHKVAAEISDVHTQLLSIWSGLEAICEDPVTEGSRFDYIANYLAPVISIDYPRQILSNLLYTIEKKHSEAFSLLEPYLGSTDGDRLAVFTDLLIGDQKHDVHKSVLSKLQTNYAVAFRYWHTAERFSSPSQSLKEIERHEKKILWQLARIYRLRNSIVHQGKAIFTAPLVTEHAHSYLDKVVRLVVLEMDHYPHLQSPFSAILNIDDSHAAHKKRIQEAGSSEAPSSYLFHHSLLV